MWFLVRGRRLKGFKFRRQHPIGPYVADFCCKKPRLVVELDGSQHLRQGEEDAKRTEFLEAWGYQVLRFWNNDVLSNTDAVLEVILNKLMELSERPSPCPLPDLGEGKEDRMENL